MVRLRCITEVEVLTLSDSKQNLEKCSYNSAKQSVTESFGVFIDGARDLNDVSTCTSLGIMLEEHGLFV
jgi:hypothetical protein